MKPISVMFLAAVMAAVTLVAPLFGASQVRIQRRVNVTTIPVFVTDGRDRFVPGLTVEDFQLIEDGTEQELTAFDQQAVPLAVVLAVDTSLSMTATLPLVKAAAARFVELLRPDDSVKLIQFSDRVTSVEGFTADRQRLLTAIAKLEIGGATALLNALDQSLAELRRFARADAGAVRRKSAIVVLSDGDDTVSAFTEIDVARKARDTDAVVFAVRMVGAAEDEKRLRDQSSVQLLESLADDSGGRLLLRRPDDLERSYQQVADELRNQYVLGYVSNNAARDGKFRRVSVSLKGKRNARLRYKPGYYAARG